MSKFSVGQRVRFSCPGYYFEGIGTGVIGKVYNRYICVHVDYHNDPEECYDGWAFYEHELEAIE